MCEWETETETERATYRSEAECSSFHHVGAGARTRLLSLSSKHLFPLSHLVRPLVCFVFRSVSSLGLCVCMCIYTCVGAGGEPVLLTCSIAVKSHHDHSYCDLNVWLGACLQFQRFSSLSSWQGTLPFLSPFHCADCRTLSSLGLVPCVVFSFPSKVSHDSGSSDILGSQLHTTASRGLHIGTPLLQAWLLWLSWVMKEIP